MSLSGLTQADEDSNFNRWKEQVRFLANGTNQTDKSINPMECCSIFAVLEDWIVARETAEGEIYARLVESLVADELEGMVQELQDSQLPQKREERDYRKCQQI